MKSLRVPAYIIFGVLSVIASGYAFLLLLVSGFANSAALGLVGAAGTSVFMILAAICFAKASKLRKLKKEK